MTLFKVFVLTDLRLLSYAVIPLQVTKSYFLYLYIDLTLNKLRFQDLNFSDLRDSNSDIGQLIHKANVNNQIFQLFQQSQIISYMNCVSIILLSFRLFFQLSLEIKSVSAYKEVVMHLFDGIKRYLFLMTLFTIAFTLFAFIYFGAYITEFSSLTTAFFSVYMMILNDKQLLSKMIK